FKYFVNKETLKFLQGFFIFLCVRVERITRCIAATKFNAFTNVEPNTIPHSQYAKSPAISAGL
ncbi:hypothetical protein, partial [Alistipes putredinis]|uniref:hypothetical protein n=1 Tax=Alistipes putredinis TaxID=28117 RepID=UPI002432CCE3